MSKKYNEEVRLQNLKEFVDEYANEEELTSVDGVRATIDIIEEQLNNLRKDNQLLKDELKAYKDLEEQLGCSLEFVFKVLKAPKIYIEGMNVRSEYDDKFKFHSKSNQYIISPYAMDYTRPEFLFVDRWSYGYDLRLKDYKKTWWLKEDKTE